MEVTDIPFNQYIRIEKPHEPTGPLLELNPSECHANHIGTVHACVQMTLAEAASGEFLMQTLPGFKEHTFGVLRRVEAKYKNPMQGKIAARAVSTADDLHEASDLLSTKGRAIVPVTIEVVDAENSVGLQATFHWFLQTDQNP
jgi:hypothetical protein